MPTRFALTFDYLCPFARNANEFVLEGLRAGADWDVTFTPYSLAQGHVAEGQPDVWDADDPTTVSGIHALLVGLAVRDAFPDHFLDVHEALFAARHDAGRDLKDADVLRDVLASVGLDPEVVLAAVVNGEPFDTLRKEHERNVSDHDVWGVPTFIAGDRAVFIRLLDRPAGDGAAAIERIERIVELVADVPDLHEFKQTDLPV
ncbi:MAG: DsbA family protein [Actinobacteria bacterium]|nr:DsbA family protein [Actinomycetota bacterium]